MDTGEFQFDSNVKIGITSGDAEPGLKLAFDSFNGGNYAIQSGVPDIGSSLAVSGGMNPTGLYPGCDKSFWTCKQGYKFDETASYVIDSSVYLLNLTESGGVKTKIDLEPVILSIIQNLMPQGNSTKDLRVASYWVNPHWYHYKTAETDEQKATYRNSPRYCGILGPVYEGVVNYTDVTTRAPWNLYDGPRFASNIFARDIIVDAFENLWCLLTIGWETVKPYDNTNVPYFNWATLGWPRNNTPYAYQEMDVSPYNTRYWYPCNTNTGAYNAGGFPRLRQFLVCFFKSKNYKVWDFVPFIPGTYGKTGSTGIASRKICSPPLKLDTDKYGNVYCCAGVYTCQDYTSGKIYHNGYNAPEFYYFYAKPSSERAIQVASGLDSGAIGGTRYWSAVAIGGYNCTYTTPSGNFLRSLSTWSLSGDTSHIVKFATDKYNKEERYFHLSVGNKSFHRAYFKLDLNKRFPHPELLVDETLQVRFDGPNQIRSREFEFTGNSTNTIQYQQLLMDLACVYAQCDLLECSIYQLDSANNRPINTKDIPWQLWYNYIKDWPTNILGPTRAQLNPYQKAFYMVASGVSEGRYVGGTLPDFLYTHYTRKQTGTPTEMFVRGYCAGVTQYQQYPMWNGCDYDKSLFAPASLVVDYPEIFNVQNAICVSSQVGEDWIQVPSPVDVPHQYYTGMHIWVASYDDKGNRVKEQCKSIINYSSSTKKITVKNWDWLPTAGTEQILSVYPASPTFPHIYKIYRNPYEHWCRTGAFPILPTRNHGESTTIIPMVDLKHDIFIFTSLSWDSINNYYSRYPVADSGYVYGHWPYRWHSMKRYVSTSSPNIPGLYYLEEVEDKCKPTTKEDIFRYSNRYKTSIQTLNSDLTIPEEFKIEVETAIQDIKIQYYGGFVSTGGYYDGILNDLKFGNFGDSVRCEDTIGILIRQIEIDLDVYKEAGEWKFNASFDPWVGHRVYYVKLAPNNATRRYKKGSTDTKDWGIDTVSWFEVSKDWKDPASPNETKPLVQSVSFKDLPNDQLAKICGWNKEHKIIEKMCGFCFTKKFVNPGIRSPRHYLVASAYED